MKRNRRPLNRSLGFHSRPTQTSFESPSPSSKSDPFKLRWPLDFGYSVKGWEAVLLVSCNLIGGNWRPLDLRPMCEVPLSQNRETMTNPNVHHRCFILFYHVWGPTLIEIHWFNIWLRARDHNTWVWRCVGTAFGHFLSGAHNFMVMALGSYVTWPLANLLLDFGAQWNTMCIC